MKLTMMRHGETDRNRLNRVLGRSDLPLNETGLAQADAAGRRLSRTGFDAIYSSPMKRAYQTAEGVARYQSHPVPILVKDALIEQNFGVFEGDKRDDPAYQSEKHAFFKPFAGGESMLDVAARVYHFLDTLAREARLKKQENILLVTHGGVCRLIENYFNGMDNEEFASFFMQNCETRTFEFPNPNRDTLQVLSEEGLFRLENEKPALKAEQESLKQRSAYGNPGAEQSVQKPDYTASNNAQNAQKEEQNA